MRHVKELVRRFLDDRSGMTSLEFALISVAVALVFSAVLLSFTMRMETVIAGRGDSYVPDMIVTGSVKKPVCRQNNSPYLRWNDLVNEDCATDPLDQPFPPR
ncbi:MAG: hypothetical protein C0606_10675 [Hyphomicrobiales bacterium]|nr:MAG: hypothetical protein C0606_10675 [Hyphomicrobiales bacterium]